MQARYRLLPGKSPHSLLFLIFIPLVLSQVIATPTEKTVEKSAPTPEQVEFFEKSIRPVLAEHCYGCHSADGGASGGLRLDSRDAILAGGNSGPVLVPGNPDESLLLQKVLLTDKHRMPKGEDALPPQTVANLKTWIEQGAYWPAGDQPVVAVKASVDVAAKVEPVKATPEQIAYFKSTVQPIFVNHCYNCHSAAFKEAGGLRVDTREGFFGGGKSGPAVVPGNPDASVLIKKVLLTDEKLRMPRESAPLSTEEIAVLTKWVKDGAAWPDETEALPLTSAALLQKYADLKQHYWAFQPLTHPSVPEVSKKSWPTNDIDRFVLAKLEEKKLSPVADADPITLIRRVTYDLTGLPPTPEAVAAFRKDHSQRAYERLVDGLLQSPRYGERWGRHWLDVARYGESSGPSRNMPYPHAWRYRNYVIDSVNQDVPFNRFIQEQVAGDLLPAADPAERDRLNIATGFLALGTKDVNQRFKARFIMDNVDDQIDTVSRSTLAMTVTCARCHDHKFDPIPTTDYYSMAGIFTSSENAAGLGSRMGGSSLDYYEPKQLAYLSTAASAQMPADQAAQVAKLKEEAAAAKKVFDALSDTPEGRALEADGKQVQLVLLRKYQHLHEQAVLTADLGQRGYGIHAEREGKPDDTWVRIRGVEERHGPKVPRGFLTAFTVPGAPTVDPKQSGRLQLAEWLTNPANPLTPRVYANRVWQHLFGDGIVTTVDNFGVNGDRPSNPELLDYLAQEFIRDGWSTKKLIRTVVLSHTYRLSSEAPAAYLEIDPANRLLWRHSPRRLEAEEVRDSVLASAGTLELTPPANSPAATLPMIEISDDGKVARTIEEEADSSLYRSIYLPLLRDLTPSTLAAFDPVTQTLVTGRRDATTVPTQALFMLNSNFVRKQSITLADKLLAEHGQSPEKLISEAYQLVLCRQPSKIEEERDLKFLTEFETLFRKSPPPSRAVAVQTADLGTPKVVLTGDDGIDHISAPPVIPVQPKDAKEAAWMGLVQSLYASAEFQFVR